MTEDRSCWSCRWQGNNWVSYAGAESDCRKRFGNGSGDGCEHWTENSMDDEREARIIGTAADKLPVAMTIQLAIGKMLDCLTYINELTPEATEDQKGLVARAAAVSQVWLDIVIAALDSEEGKVAETEEAALLSIEDMLYDRGLLDDEEESVYSE